MMTASYQQRPYRHPGDLTAALDIVRARPAARVLDYPGLSDLHELLGREEIIANSQVWLAPGDSLAGFAFNDHYPDFCGISFEYRADHAGIAADMVRWCIENFRACRRPEASLLQQSVAPDHHERIALLEANGFRRDSSLSLVKMTRLLSEPIPAPRLPQGFTLRAFKGEEEMDEMVALHRAAFSTENLTPEHRRSWMLAPGYDSGLDLVAVAPGGQLAAYVFYATHGEENELAGARSGCADSAGTHPKFRGLGLSRALLLEGLRLLKDRGLDRAALTTAGDNLAMQRTAAGAGYRAAGEILYYVYDIPEKA